MSKKFTSIVIGKGVKDKKAKTVLERIIVHEIKFINDVINADSKLIFKDKKQSAVVARKSREVKLTKSKVQGINLLTGEPLYGGKK